MFDSDLIDLDIFLFPVMEEVSRLKEEKPWASELERLKSCSSDGTTIHCN